jgi:hypothetical protein
MSGTISTKILMTDAKTSVKVTIKLTYVHLVSIYLKHQYIRGAGIAQSV